MGTGYSFDIPKFPNLKRRITSQLSYPSKNKTTSLDYICCANDSNLAAKEAVFFSNEIANYIRVFSYYLSITSDNQDYCMFDELVYFSYMKYME